MQLETFMKYIFGFVGAAGFEPATSWSQTRRDDRTTLRPENITVNDAERLGLEPRHRLPDDRLAICSVTTPAPLLLSIKELASVLRVQIYRNIFHSHKFYTINFYVFFCIFFNKIIFK